MSPDHTEQLVQLSRRQLWLALLVILTFGLVAILQLADPAQHSRTLKIWSNFPIAIVVAAAALGRARKRVKASATSREMQAVLDDELRQASLKLAYRNAFFMMLLMQPLMAVVVTAVTLANPVAVMAAASALTGSVTTLASLLYYDR